MTGMKAKLLMLFMLAKHIRKNAKDHKSRIPMSELLSSFKKNN